MTLTWTWGVAGRSGSDARRQLDVVVVPILGIGPELHRDLATALVQLTGLARVSSKVHRSAGSDDVGTE